MMPELIGFWLHECSKLKALKRGVSLHAIAFKTGMHQSDVIVANHVINMYAKCGKMSQAHQVFDEMPERNLVSWSALISGYQQLGLNVSALQLFARMRISPNQYVLASAIAASAGLSSFVIGQQLHALSIKLGYALSMCFVSNALISMYMKCGRSFEAFSVHVSSNNNTLVSYNALIGGFLENNEPVKGFELFKVMMRCGLLPDRFTFVGLFGSCLSLNCLQVGSQLHCLTIKLKLDSSAFIGNVMMTMYSKFDMIDEIEKVFRFIDNKDLISWNSFMSACSRSDEHVKSLRVFREMLTKCDIVPDEFTFASILAATAGLASLRHGKQIHAHLIRGRLCQDVGVDNSLVNMYAKCGCIESAYYIFSQMLHRNLVSWNTIIAGFGNHGLGRKALELFETMKKMGVQPDAITFLGVLIACNHAGLVDEGKTYFNSMQETYGISLNIEHFSCLIDLLGRAGNLLEAEEYIMKFPFGSDPIVLGSLLSACRLHGDVVIAEHMAQWLLKFQPVSTSPYVLLSNLYALDEMWKEVAETRKMMKGSGLKKEQSYSMIEVMGTFHKFTVGKYSNVKLERIKDILKILDLDARKLLFDCLA